MLAGDLLLAGGLGECERYLWLLEHPLEMLENGVLRLFERGIAHHHLAVGGAKVEHAARLHHVEAVDRLLEERPLHDHLESIERLNLERWLGHHPEGVDQEDVWRLDHVGRQRHLGELLRRHAARFGRALGVEHHLLGRVPLRAAVDVAAGQLEEHRRHGERPGDRAGQKPPVATGRHLRQGVVSAGFMSLDPSHGKLLTTGMVTPVVFIGTVTRQTLPFLPTGQEIPGRVFSGKRSSRGK